MFFSTKNILVLSVSLCSMMTIAKSETEAEFYKSIDQKSCNDFREHYKIPWSGFETGKSKAIIKSELKTPVVYNSCSEFRTAYPKLKDDNGKEKI